MDIHQSTLKLKSSCKQALFNLIPYPSHRKQAKNRSPSIGPSARKLKSSKSSAWKWTSCIKSTTTLSRKSKELAATAPRPTLTWSSSSSQTNWQLRRSSRLLLRRTRRWRLIRGRTRTALSSTLSIRRSILITVLNSNNRSRLKTWLESFLKNSKRRRTAFSSRTSTRCDKTSSKSSNSSSKTAMLNWNLSRKSPLPKAQKSMTDSSWLMEMLTKESR